MAQKHVLLSETTTSNLVSYSDGSPLALTFDGNDFSLQSITGGGDSYESLIFEDLVTKIASSSLVPGKFYLISDYSAVYYMQYTDSSGYGLSNDEPIVTSSNEPILVQAISNNQLSTKAVSLTYPTDEIEYVYDLVLDPANDRKYDHASTGTRGVITFRKDPVSNNSRNYDWRNVMFRRWRDSNGNYTVLRPYESDPMYGSGDYLDFTSFNVSDIDAGYCFSNEITSPVAVIPGTGMDDIRYDLDNFVLKVGTYAAYNTITLGYGQTIESLNSGNRLFMNNFGTFAFNLVNGNVNNYPIMHNRGRFIGNTVETEFSYNTISVCLNNISSELSQNVGATMESNTVSGPITGNSSFSGLTYNTATQITGNTVATILMNTVSGPISANDGNNIYSNTCASISNNSVLNISQNYESNTAVLNITSNSGNSIDNNVMNGNIQFNIINEISGNINNGIYNNSVGFIKDNQHAGLIYNNEGNEISANTIDGDIYSNTVKIIFSNLSNVINISENSLNFITENNNVGYISKNVGAEIHNNSNSGNITRNNNNRISSNQNGGSIADNSGGLILGNLILGDILTNSSVEISSNGNTVTSIARNTVREISGNTTSGSIYQNTGNFIAANTTVGEIQYNEFGEITNNSNNGNIQYNNSGQILFNDNDGPIEYNKVRLINDNDVNVLAIKYNSGDKIESNTNTGEIAGNNVVHILTNAAAGQISSNTGTSITNNSNTSAILENNVAIINNNIGSDINGNTGYLIQGNNVQGIQRNVVSHIEGNITEGSGYIGYNNMNFINNNQGFTSISYCVGHRMYMCSAGSPCSIANSSGIHFSNITIYGDVYYHTFIDELIVGSSLNPNAGMSSLSLKTKSAYFDSDGQHHMIDTSLGTFAAGTVV